MAYHTVKYIVDNEGPSSRKVEIEAYETLNDAVDGILDYLFVKRGNIRYADWFANDPVSPSIIQEITKHLLDFKSIWKSTYRRVGSGILYMIVEELSFEINVESAEPLETFI